MQGERSNVELFPETLEFDPESTTSNPGMDLQVCWLNPVETQNLQDYLISPSETGMPFANVTSQESASLSMWNSGEPSSSQQPHNLGNHGETRMEHHWEASFTGNGGDGLRIEERGLEATNMLSLENVNRNLNNHHINNSQRSSRSSNSNGLPLNFGQNLGYAGTCSHAPEAGHVLSSGGSSSTCENSSRGRLGCSIDGWHLCGKRKYPEGIPEQASASGSSSISRQRENSSSMYSSHYNPNTSFNIPRASEILSGGLRPPAQLNMRISSTTGVLTLDSNNAESSHRNSRMRINRPVSPPIPITRSLESNVWSTNRPVSPPIPLTRSIESSSVIAGAISQSQRHTSVSTRSSRNAQPRTGASSSRIVSSSRNPIVVRARSTPSREETNSSSVSRSVRATDTWQSVPVPRRPGVLRNVRAGIPGIVAPQGYVHPGTSQNPGGPRGVGLRGHALLQPRLPPVMDWQRDGVAGIPVPMPTWAGSREGRSSMISQYVLMLEQSMRLDVDNMSYEELLALEERIGDVNTGLSEDTVLKRLKRRKHTSVIVEASAQVEPCCVCQEEYLDGEEMGCLDCGHEFHTTCIKQWLMQKNLCPICKTSALPPLKCGALDK